MHYHDHALLSARKFACNIEDTILLHRLIDSSKHFFPANQHRLFSHNLWFIQVLTELIGDTIPNSKSGGTISTRDILFTHCREDHNGHVPSLQDWLACLRFDVPPEHRKWFNTCSARDLQLLQEIKGGSTALLP